MTTTVEEITGRPAESVEEFIARRSDLFAVPTGAPSH
jgi:hypothetical protein